MISCLSNKIQPVANQKNFFTVQEKIYTNGKQMNLTGSTDTNFVYCNKIELNLTNVSKTCLLSQKIPEIIKLCSVPYAISGSNLGCNKFFS